jgi:hypothetical protein
MVTTAGAVTEEAGDFGVLAAVAGADDEAEPGAGAARLDDPAVRAPDEHPPSRMAASRNAVQIVARRITGTAFRWGVVDDCGCAISVYLSV